MMQQEFLFEMKAYVTPLLAASHPVPGPSISAIVLVVAVLATLLAFLLVLVFAWKKKNDKWTGPEPWLGGVPPPPPDPGVCPVCGARMEDGACPIGGLHISHYRCTKCDAILKNGVCPECGETEYCPTCGSLLVNGACPVDCTIVRCPVCNGILTSGGCPKGCPPRALNLGWSGSDRPSPSPWKLEVIAPAGFAGEACELPFEVVIGRSASERKTTGAYVQLHFDDRRKSCVCPRRYVKLVCDSATAEVVVELLSRVGRAVVDGRTLSAPGDKAVLPEGGILDLLQTGYRLKLVRASVEASGLRGAVTTTTRPANE